MKKNNILSLLALLIFSIDTHAQNNASSYLVFNPADSSITINRADGRSKLLTIEAKDLQLARSMSVNLSDRAHKVVSFDLYCVPAPGAPVVTIKEPVAFSNIHVSEMKKIQKGVTLYFVNVKVDTEDGIRTIDEFYISVN